MLVQVHPLDDSVTLLYSVIVARYEQKYLFVRHQDRSTWEIPGGHIETGESPLDAAKRELREETSAEKFEITPVANYSVTVNQQTTHGRLFFAQVDSLSGNLAHEIAQVKAFTKLPDALTYPDIQPLLFNEVVTKQE